MGRALDPGRRRGDNEGPAPDHEAVHKDVGGKIHLDVGGTENDSLNNDVDLTENLLEKTKGSPPWWRSALKHGDRAEYGWNGGPRRPNAISRLRSHPMRAWTIVDRPLRTAPPGVDMGNRRS